MLDDVAGAVHCVPGAVLDQVADEPVRMKPGLDGEHESGNDDRGAEEAPLESDWTPEFIGERLLRNFQLRSLVHAVLSTLWQDNSLHVGLGRTDITLRNKRAGVTFLVLCFLLCLPSLAFAYGYSRADDPLLKSFRLVVVAARKADWAAVSKETKVVGWQLVELKTDLRVDFAPRLQAAERSQKARAVIVAWANLVYLGLRQKFHWNLNEKLADFRKSRSRLVAARYYYEVVLAGNVRRYDRARKSTLHTEILALFDRARSQIGRPALFGSSSVAAEPAAFRETTRLLLAKLRRAFPYFKHGRSSLLPEAEEGKTPKLPIGPKKGASSPKPPIKPKKGAPPGKAPKREESAKLPKKAG